METLISSYIQELTKMVMSLTPDTLASDVFAPEHSFPDEVETGELVNDPTSRLTGLLSLTPPAGGTHPRCFGGGDGAPFSDPEILPLFRTGGAPRVQEMVGKVTRRQLPILLTKSVSQISVLGDDFMKLRGEALVGGAGKDSLGAFLRPSALRALIRGIRATKVLELFPGSGAGEVLVACSGLADVRYVGAMLPEDYTAPVGSAPPRRDIRGVLDLLGGRVGGEGGGREGGRLSLVKDLSSPAVAELGDPDLVVVNRPADSAVVGNAWGRLKAGGCLVVISPDGVERKGKTGYAIVKPTQRTVVDSVLSIVGADVIGGWVGVEDTRGFLVGCRVFIKGEGGEGELIAMLRESRETAGTSRPVMLPSLKKRMDFMTVDRSLVMNMGVDGASDIAIATSTLTNAHICLALGERDGNPLQFRFIPKETEADLFVYPPENKLTETPVTVFPEIGLRIHPCKSKEEAEMASALLANYLETVAPATSSGASSPREVIRSLTHPRLVEALTRRIKREFDASPEGRSLPGSVLLFHRSGLSTLAVANAFPDATLHIVTMSSVITPEVYQHLVPWSTKNKLRIHPFSVKQAKALTPAGTTIPTDPPVIGMILQHFARQKDIAPRLIWNGDAPGKERM